MLASVVTRGDGYHTYRWPGEKTIRTPKNSDDRFVLDGNLADLGRVFERTIATAGNVVGFWPEKFIKLPDSLKQNLLVALADRGDLVTTRLVPDMENTGSAIVVGGVDRSDEFLAPDASVAADVADLLPTPAPESESSDKAKPEDPVGERDDDHKKRQIKRYAIAAAVGSAAGFAVYYFSGSRRFGVGVAGVSVIATGYVHNKDAPHKN